MNDYNLSQKNAPHENQVDFGRVLENAMNVFKKFFGIAGVSFLLLTILYIVLIFGLIGIAFGFASFSQTMTNFRVTNFSIVETVAYLFFMSVFTGISTIFTAGIYQMAYLASANKEYEVGTLFYFFKTKYLKELFLSGVLIGLLTNSISYVFEYLDFQFLGFVVLYTFTLFTVLTIPLIIFSDLKAIDAITNSFRLVGKNFLVILGLLIVAIILSFLGVIGLCIGIFFTFPFMYATIFCIYDDILPINETDVIDEIGLNEE